MDNVSLWAESIDWFEIVVNVLLIVVPPLVGVALAALGGVGAVEMFRRLIVAFRPVVDEPEDPLIIDLAATLGKSPEDVVAAIKKLLDAMENEPVREVRLDTTVN